MDIDAIYATQPDDPGLVDPLTRRPAALLLDFGGVIFSTVKRAEGRVDAAQHLAHVLARGGHHIGQDRVLESLEAGLTAIKYWKHAMSRTQQPRELSHREIWEQFLLADLPEAARAMVAGNGESLLAEINPMLNDHVVRDGIPQLFDLARSFGMPIGVVSNAHSGLAHRRLLERHDLARFIDVQLYSDECGLRKPNPEILQRAAAALSVPVARCWYVGDCQDRDLVAGRRAGVGAVVLTRSKHTDSPPFIVHGSPDAIFDDPTGLVSTLAESVTPLEDTHGSEGAPLAETPGANTRGPLRSGEVVSVPAAVLFDQGGVLYTTEPTPDRLDSFVSGLVGRLRRAGHKTNETVMSAAIARGRSAYSTMKNSPPEPDGTCREVSHREFWMDLVGQELDDEARAWLGAEASWLAAAYAWSKSQATIRPGVLELLQFCTDNAIPTAVVSNTHSARTARRRLDTLGLAQHLATRVYSDELGRRKPDPAPVLEATRALGIAAANCWFVGDKPWRDVAAGRAAGVGTTVIVRGGSPTDEQLDRAFDSAAPDLVAADMSDVLSVLRSAVMSSV